jgi:hypothetical protein
MRRCEPLVSGDRGDQHDRSPFLARRGAAVFASSPLARYTYGIYGRFIRPISIGIRQQDRLDFSFHDFNDWFLQFRLKSCVKFMPLYAGRRLPSIQISGRLFSEVPFASDFDGIVVFTTRDRKVCSRSSL